MSELDNEKAFETRLTQELARVPAPDGFADRVMAKVAAERSSKGGRGRVLGFRGGVAPRSRIWMAVAATVLLAVATGSGLRFEQHQQRQAAEQREEQAKAALAEQQFELAMQVTSRTLAEVQERIGKAGAKQVRD